MKNFSRRQNSEILETAAARTRSEEMLKGNSSHQVKTNSTSQFLVTVYNIVFLVSKKSKEGPPTPSCKNKKQVIRYFTAFSKHHKTWACTTHQILLKKVSQQHFRLGFLTLMKS